MSVAAALAPVVAELSVGNDAGTSHEADELAAWALCVALAKFADDHSLAAHIDRADAKGSAAWVLSRMRSIAELLPESSALAEANNPVFWQPIPEESVSRLTAAVTDSGSFERSREPDTRWLGDLYTALSPSLCSKHALIQTPKFITDFIVDRTLTPAIATFGLGGLKVIDPVCGSGSFLLDAFHRLLAESRQQNPGRSDTELAGAALSSLFGIDRVWHAAAVTEFRLLMAAMTASGCRTFDMAREHFWPVNIEVGDSLLRSDLEGQFHVVIGNPPYLAVSDATLDAVYRKRFDVCTGRYALSVPFAQQFFRLARTGDEDTAGYTGQLTSAAFMKREFGRPLIEAYFAEQVSLSHVVDTSGAFIPGHGVPTVILLGRNHPPNPAGPVRLIVGKRGEPAMPETPEAGHVWQSILRNISGPGSADMWTEAQDVPRTQLDAFPWRLNVGATSSVLETITAAPERLGQLASRIGYYAATGADEVFTAPAATYTQAGITLGTPLSPTLTGADIRDWVATPADWVIVPRDLDNGLVAAGARPAVFRLLWPFKSMLAGRRNFSGRTYHEDGRNWYDWHQLSNEDSRSASLICYAWVSTHNHFAQVPPGAIPLQSAPVIALTKSATANRDSILAVLNSSTSCFWLKQSSNSKGRPAENQTGTGEAWDAFYEITASRLKDLPMPSTLDIPYGAAMRQLTDALVQASPSATLNSSGPDRQALESARHQWHDIRGAMIAAQEELDWAVYQLFGLADQALLTVSAEDLPRINAGERAFEIVMARRIRQGSLQTTWFTRHGITPKTELPEDWPDTYRAIVERRIKAIESDTAMRVLEQPENKRRWQTTGWDQLMHDALSAWLLDRLSSAEFWYDQSGVPAARTASQLADLLREATDVTSATRLLSPDKSLESILADLLDAEQVPVAAALRLRPSGLAKYHDWESVWQFQDGPANIGEPPKALMYTAADFQKQSYWRLRGKVDRPKERFHMYTRSATGPVFGWAGWTHSDRVRILIAIAEQQIGSSPATALPLLAGLREQLPWLHRFEPSNEQIPHAEAFYHKALRQLGTTDENIAAWMPESPRRGRPRKTS